MRSCIIISIFLNTLIDRSAMYIAGVFWGCIDDVVGGGRGAWDPNIEITGNGKSFSFNLYRAPKYVVG